MVAVVRLEVLIASLRSYRGFGIWDVGRTWNGPYAGARMVLRSISTSTGVPTSSLCLWVAFVFVCMCVFAEGWTYFESRSRAFVSVLKAECNSPLR